jgi:hypothetical protein
MGVGDVDDLGEISKGPRHPIDPVDNDDLNLAGFDDLQKPLESRPLHRAAAQASVVVHVRKHDPSDVARILQPAKSLMGADVGHILATETPTKIQLDMVDSSVTICHSFYTFSSLMRVLSAPAQGSSDRLKCT